MAKKTKEKKVEKKVTAKKTKEEMAKEKKAKEKAFEKKVAGYLLEHMDYFQELLEAAARTKMRREGRRNAYGKMPIYQSIVLSLKEKLPTGKKNLFQFRYELTAEFIREEDANGQESDLYYLYEDDTEEEEADWEAEEEYWAAQDIDWEDIEDSIDSLEFIEDDDEYIDIDDDDEDEAEEKSATTVKNGAAQAEQKDTPEFTCSLGFTVEVRVFTGISGNPFMVKITECTGSTMVKPLPPKFQSAAQFLKVTEQIMEDFNLSERSLKTLREFAMFKYHTMIQKSEHPEAFRTYYNLLVQGEETDSMNQFVHRFYDLFGLSEEDVVAKSERQAMDWLDAQNKRYDEDKNDFEDKKLIYIYDCQERPYINEDAGTGSERSVSEKRALLYLKFWNYIAQYARVNPTTTIIVSMKDYIYANSFSKDNELNHRIFGHRLFVPEMSMQQVIDTCLKEFRYSSISIASDFEEEFVKYVKAVYQSADLKGEKFAKDVINRVYSYYFRMTAGRKALTVDCIPPYSKDIRSADDVLERLNKMVGLKSVKETFQTIYKKQIADPESAKKEGHHMMFYGNPGTGKTTVARLAAELLYQSGFLKTSKYVEATVGDIVSAYKSNSANKVRQKVKEAIDGVLFIDEAYGLANNNEHCEEALNVLIQEMLNYQDRLVVILAGYEEKMMELLKTNMGLSSRIAHQVHFDDYSVEELKKIFDLQCKEIGFTLDPSAEQVLEECLSMRRLKEFFGNGRDVANLISELQGNWSQEYYDIVKKSGNENIYFPKVFYKKHFENVIPPKNELSIDALVGLETVKKQMEKFKNQVRYLHRIKEMGMKNLPESFMHMIFMGNPGTGKTTVAKMIANDLYSLGVLKTNRLVVTEKKDLISPYRGESSQKIKNLINKAIGGVMLIDEAYSLVDADTAGREVIEVLLTAMVDHKEDTVFIFAGYPVEMRKFLRINPGIPSRIGYTFVFEDYKTEELLEIFEKKMSDSGFVVSTYALPKVKEIMEYFREMPRFGNGRFVEQVIARIIANRAERECNNLNYNYIEERDIPEIGEMIETNTMGYRLLDPKKITEDDRLRTAYHELGHAIAIYEFDPMMQLEKISVVNRAFSLGRVSFKRNFRNRTEEELKNEIIISLAGRSSERVFFGNCDEGCVSDYENAKEIADSMINRYGMCEIGLTTVSDLIRQGDRDATKLIQKYQKCIESMAQELVSGREFNGEEFKQKVNEFMNK